MTIIKPGVFDASGAWPEPDMELVKPTRPAPRAMSQQELHKVFGPWAEWLRDASEVKGAPLDYVALSLLTTASACIGNSRWVSPWDGWQEPPILWAMLVGNPSAGKSPALDAVLDGVKSIEAEMGETYKAAKTEWEAADEIASVALAQWKTDVKKAMAEGEDAPPKPSEADAGRPPIRERIRIADATTEKVADLLSSSWRGLLMCRDELSGWLASMDRYSGGGDRPFWLEAYGGRSYIVDRKSLAEPILVDRLSVAVLGGTQPDKLDSLLLKSDDDGLLSRFLTVFPDPVPLCRPTAQLDLERLTAGMERLRALSPATDDAGNPRPFFLNLTDHAAEGLQEFRQQCRDWEVDATGIYKSHIGKLPGLAIRVSCVLAHLDYAATANGMIPTEIDSEHIGRACHLVGEHYRQHAFRAYGAGRPPAEIVGARVIADIIQTERVKRFKVRDIQHRERAGLRTAGDVKAALHVLKDADWIAEHREQNGGRPSVTFSVNPRLGGGS